MWQEMIVGSCVLLAALFILKQYWPTQRPRTGSCGGSCSGCDRAKSCSNNP